RLRRDEDREPEIEAVVAPVVLRHAGMGADDRRRFVDALGIHPRGDETGAIAERARVELWRKLLDHAVAAKALRALDDFLLGHVDRLSDERVRRGNKRNLTLQSTQQLPVPLIHFLHLNPSASSFRGS